MTNKQKTLVIIGSSIIILVLAVVLELVSPGSLKAISEGFKEGTQMWRLWPGQ